MLNFADIILKARIPIIIILIGLTALMSRYAYPPQFAYQMAHILPPDHPVRVDFENFNNEFGEDNGNTIAISIQDSNFFNIDNLRHWDDLTNRIQDVDGIESVVSITNLPVLSYENIDGKNQFVIYPWYSHHFDQDQLDISRKEYERNKMFDRMLYNENSKTSIMLAVMEKKYLESNLRDRVIKEIENAGHIYEEEVLKDEIIKNPDLKYSGMPYLRTKHSKDVKNEVSFFMLLTIVITTLILYLFFRSIRSTFISVIVVTVGVVFSFGIAGMLNYYFGGFKLNALTALVPPVVIVIGIPNCIYLINKYHIEFTRRKDKLEALRSMINQVGNVTLLTNLTTASGFAAFIIPPTILGSPSEGLMEFGLIASISIICLYIISLLIIPIWFSFMPDPNITHTKHLEKKWINYVVSSLSYLVRERRKTIYMSALFLTIIGIFGMYQVKTTGNITDDIPKDQNLYSDMVFFENNFGGIMPLEIIIDTKKKKRLYDAEFMNKIDKLKSYLSSVDEFSQPISYIDFVKYAYQTYKGKYKDYPFQRIAPDLPRLESNIRNAKRRDWFLQNDTVILLTIEEGTSTNAFSKILQGQSETKARISLRMKDVSTDRMNLILKDIELQIDKIFVDKDNVPEYVLNPSKHFPNTNNLKHYDESGSFRMKNIVITGMGNVFLEGTKFLVKNLISSLSLVIILIAIFMAWMFRNYRMVLISLIPNLIPLILTASIMGYFGIPIKPSTILVFSVAFGISVDDTIHFLAKYRQELISNNWNIRTSVYNSLNETGVSMIYTSIVLFFGFFIFTLSDFGGTVALGLLVSITLLFAMLSNLLLLPALLLSLEKRMTKKAFNEPLIDIFDEEEDIDLNRLKLKDKNL